MSDDGATSLSRESTPTLRVYAAVFAVSGIFIWLMLINDDWCDQFTFFFHARRVAAGQVPYRDFFMHFAPGLSYFLGAWFKLFGESLTGTRIFMALIGALVTTLAYDISAKLVLSPFRWIGTAGVTGAFIVSNEGFGHMVFAVPAALAAIACGVRAERNGRLSLWFLSGVCVCISALSTQTVGAAIGVAIFAAALSTAGTPKQRVIRALTVCLGTATSVTPVAILIVASGAWGQFHYDLMVWPFDRYLPFVGGVGWGAWMPPWGMLAAISKPWWLVWVPALGMAWGTVFVLPFASLGILIFSALTRRLEGRRVLLFCVIAVFVSAYPHFGAMRMLRVSLPVWIALAVVIQGLFTKDNRVSAAGSYTAWAMALFLILSSATQHSYREQLVELNTPLGRLLVHRDTQAEYEMLQRHYKPGAVVLSLPDGTAASYLMQFVNPVHFDEAIVPVYFTPEQMRQALAQMSAQNYPAIVVLPHTAGDPQWIIKTFNPSKYLEEFQTNPWNDFIAEHYVQVFQDGLVRGFVRKP